MRRHEEKGKEKKRLGRRQVKSKLQVKESERKIICAEGGV
jgi:hypothetical protein